MKNNKIRVVTLVMLLICFISYCKANDNVHSSTGCQINNDTSIVVSIEDIKLINDKLLEREYCLKISKEQEDIIKLKDEYIKEQDSVIKDMQNKIITVTNINNKLQAEYNKQKRKTIIASSIAGATGVSLVAVLVTLICR